jgi:hypothetical protein
MHQEAVKAMEDLVDRSSRLFVFVNGVVGKEEPGALEEE